MRLSTFKFICQSIYMTLKSIWYVILMMHFWCMCILHTCLYILCKKLVIISSPHLQHQQLFTTDSLLALHLIEQLKMNSSFHRPSTTLLGSTQSLKKIWANLVSKYLGMFHGFSRNKHLGNGWIWWIWVRKPSQEFRAPWYWNTAMLKTSWHWIPAGWGGKEYECDFKMMGWGYRLMGCCHRLIGHLPVLKVFHRPRPFSPLVPLQVPPATSPNFRKRSSRLGCFEVGAVSNSSLEYPP